MTVNPNLFAQFTYTSSMKLHQIMLYFDTYQVISNNNFDRIRITELYLSARWLTVQNSNPFQEESFSKSKIFKRYSLSFIKILHPKFCHLIGRLSDSFEIYVFIQRDDIIFRACFLRKKYLTLWKMSSVYGSNEVGFKRLKIRREK